MEREQIRFNLSAFGLTTFVGLLITSRSVARQKMVSLSSLSSAVLVWKLNQSRLVTRQLPELRT